MSVLLDDPEGVLTRFGRIYKEYQRVVAAYGSNLNAGVDDIYEEYATGDEGIAIDGLYSLREGYRGVHSSYLSGLTGVATKTTVEQVHRDVPLAQKTLTLALTELIRQMKANTESVNRPTLSTTSTNWASDIGDAVFVGSTVNEYGDPTDMCFDENIKFTCTSDSASGATQYQEAYTYAGEPVLATTDYLWPGGSGVTGSLTLVDAATDGILKNTDFAGWTATNTPDEWNVSTGLIGTDVLRDTSVVRGSYSLKMVSDGATLITIKQQLNSSTVKPNKCYAMNLWAKINTLDATGTVRFRLCNGTGTTLTNDAGTSQSYTRNVNGNIGTAYTQVTTFFQTPRNLPSTGVFFEISLTVSPTAARTINFDCIGFAEAAALYAGGPYIKGFSKTTSNVKGDYTTVAVANDATSNFFVKALDRIYGLRSLGLYFPSAASETVADSLLTA